MGESVTKLSAAYRLNAASVAETISLSSLKRSPANDPEEFFLNYKSPAGKLPRESVDSKMPATVPTATVFPGSIFSKLSAIDNRKVLRYSFFKPIKIAISVRDSRYRYRFTRVCCILRERALHKPRMPLFERSLPGRKFALVESQVADTAATAGFARSG